MPTCGSIPLYSTNGSVNKWTTRQNALMSSIEMDERALLLDRINYLVQSEAGGRFDSYVGRKYGVITPLG